MRSTSRLNKTNAFTWAFAWSGAGFLLALATGFKADAPFPIIFGALGFVAGVIFSAVLALTARGRSFDQMSTRVARRP